MEVTEVGVTSAFSSSQLRYRAGGRLVTFYENGTVACTCGCSLLKKEIKTKGCNEMVAVLGFVESQGLVKSTKKVETVRKQNVSK
jgi:hypothetical protein